MNERINLVSSMDVFVGKYFSIEQIRRLVLKQSEEEYKEIDKQIEKELAYGKIVDPNAMMDPSMDPNAGVDPNAAALPAGQEPGAQVGDNGIDADPSDLKKAEF